MGRRSAMKRFVVSLWRAYLRWCQYDCVDLSAAFAYYTLQSIFPLILIILSIASWLLGRQVGLSEQIISYTAGVFPPTVVDLVRATLEKLVRQGFGAGLLGAGALLVTAGNVYLTLQRGADRIGMAFCRRSKGMRLGSTRFGNLSRCASRLLFWFY